MHKRSTINVKYTGSINYDTVTLSKTCEIKHSCESSSSNAVKAAAKVATELKSNKTIWNIMATIILKSIRILTDTQCTALQSFSDIVSYVHK